MPNWKKVAVSGSAASFSSLHVDTSVTASIFSGSEFIGNLSGTASNATTASYALTASYTPGSGTAISSSYALTASYVNPLQQDVYITGSLNQLGTYNHTGSVYHTGSKFLVGLFSQTGSLNISGSTTQIGNNALLGNTVLSGSIIISGSQGQPNPTISVFGDLNQTGYTRYLPVTNNLDTSLSASYIYVSGSTQDLYFSQNAAGYANTTRLRWLEGNLYTGLLNGGLITSQSSTVYQISSGSGIIVNLNASLNNNPYPTVQYLNWDNLSQSIAPLTSSYQQAFVGIQSNGTIFQQGTPFSPAQNDAVISIGNVLFQNQSTINGFKTQPYVAYGLPQRQDIFTSAFGPLKLSGYTLAPSGSSTGSLIVGSGTAYSDGANYTVDPNNPSYVTDSGTNVSKIFRYYQSGSTWVYDTNGGLGYTTIDPSKYSNSGVLTTVQPNDWSIQRAFWFPNSVSKAIVVYYGNASYPTEAEAAANIPYESFVEAPNTAANAIYLGAIVISGNGIFTSAASYKILPGGLFRQVGGSGGGGSVVTQTLAGLSDVEISGQTDGQPLAWSTTAGHWINSPYISASVAGNASSATSASYASTASYVVLALTASTAVSSSYALTASYVNTALTASYVASSSYAVSSSNAISSSYSITASNAVSASYAVSSSYSLESLSASLAQLAISSSYATTASFALNGGSGGGGGGATTGSNTFYGDQVISGSLVATGSVGASVLLTSQTASSIVIPNGYNGLLLTPVQMQGTSSVAVGSRLIIL
jgi:hypothetical protein